jgi:ribosomal protein L32
MTEDSHSTPKQQTSITAAANAYRSKAAALSTDNNSSQYKLPNHLDSIFFKAGLS